ncbi:MAG: general secretion pathway protein GspK [Verrucomicrobia bacterium]|nr:general secretion pathway protein GspK [Verrucomicrobiota bacterium]
MRSTRGIALLMVMVVIIMLGILAGGFAYSMKVETRLARNQSYDTQLEWLGRSGVEYARYILAQELLAPGHTCDALNQKWAGGFAETNEILAPLSLTNVSLGAGSFSIRIIDQERKFNINTADDTTLQQAFNLIGIDYIDSAPIIEAIDDWRDPNMRRGLNAAESDYYLGLKPPYIAKNGPIDELAELLLIRGITPDMYWGPGTGLTNLPVVTYRNGPGLRAPTEVPTTPPVGLADLFTTLSARVININTAPAAVLQLLPGIDANAAQGIVSARAGPDGVEGDGDDIPFQNPGELMNVPGISSPQIGFMLSRCTVRSITFEVHVEAQIGGVKRQYVALLRRNSPMDIPILFFYEQ